MGRIIGWLTAAVAVTVLFASVYLAFQQAGRRSANDAPATASAVQEQLMGTDPVPAGPRLELSQASGLFTLVYGADDKPESGTATLHKELPLIPAGVLQAARRTGYDAVTWQPEPNLRMAIVARSSNGRVVVAGQSLTPYEDRDRFTLAILALGWLGSLVVIAAGYAGTGYALRRRRLPPENQR